jgi:hypothetical protein
VCLEIPRAEGGEGRDPRRRRLVRSAPRLDPAFHDLDSGLGPRSSLAGPGRMVVVVDIHSRDPS